MKSLLDLLGMLAFQTRALRAQAGRQALLWGTAFFASGFLAFAVVRHLVYETLIHPYGFFEPSGVLGFFIQLNIIQVFLFTFLVYIPAVIILSNGIAGAGLGLFISREEYRAHASVLLPLWGLLFLIDAPLQYLAPQFLVLPTDLFGITIGMSVLLPLLILYTLWAIKQLDYLSAAQALAVFALSCFTLPVYYFLTLFLPALPFLILFPLLYAGYQWIRSYFALHANERDFKQHLHTLTANPQDADAQYQLGLIHLKRRNLDVARRYFEAALKIDAADPDYHYYLGRASEIAEDWTQALEQYEETYRLNPDYGLGDVFREVGKGYLKTGEAEKAMEFLKFFLSKRNSDPEGRYWLAVALMQAGDIEQMRVQLNMILEQARSNPRFFRKENREWIYKARNMIRDFR
jgi:tetratricopeptide (TPR) repeat protein